jgi:hypothetical protein
MQRTGQNETRFAGRKPCAEVAKLMRQSGQKPREYANIRLVKVKIGWLKSVSSRLFVHIALRTQQLQFLR